MHHFEQCVHVVFKGFHFTYQKWECGHAIEMGMWTCNRNGNVYHHTRGRKIWTTVSNRKQFVCVQKVHTEEQQDPTYSTGVCGECKQDAGYARTSGVWEGPVHSSQDSTKHLSVQLVVSHQCLQGSTWRYTTINDTPHTCLATHRRTLKKMKYSPIRRPARLSSLRLRGSWFRKHTP